MSVWRTAQNCNKTIRCAELRKGDICFGDLIITKPEPKTFKVVCVAQLTGETFFTVGKVYTWKDGTMTNDHGFTYCPDHGVGIVGTDPDKWDLSAWYKFVKIVEE